MIQKPGKDQPVPSPYRPISLLSCLSKLLEKCLLTWITPYLRAHNVIRTHLFGFRERHRTIEQVNRIASEIRTSFEHREYWSAIFLDVSQALGRLEGLMHKIIMSLPEFTHKLHEYSKYSTYSTQIPQANDVTYIFKRLAWRKHIECKKVHLKLRASSLHWIINSRSPQVSALQFHS